MISKNIEINNSLGEIYYPITNSTCVTGYNNYNLKQILELIKKASYSGEVYNKNYYICDIDGRYYIYIDKVFLDTIEGVYKVFIYLNGTLLTEYEDYVFIAPTVVRLTFPAKLNDVFIYEFVTSPKYLLSEIKNTSSYIEEKILINDIFNKINIYAKGENSNG